VVSPKNVTNHVKSAKLRESSHNYSMTDHKKNVKCHIGMCHTGYAPSQMDRSLLTTLQAGKNPNDIPWHKSEAKTLLKKDIDDGKHKEMKPEVLHGTREEYQAFPLKTFRNHIYQEVDSRAKRAHRYAKKKKRASFVDPGFGV